MLPLKSSAPLPRLALFVLVLSALVLRFDASGAMEQRFLAGKLMAGTPYETPLYVIGDGKGPAVLVLAGVHGDEPGAWRAALDLVRHPPRFDGRIVVVPQANRVADEAGLRSRPEIGDLNRLYPGRPSGLPMAVMASQLVDVVRRYRVQVVLDLHESWDYVTNMPTQPAGVIDTAYLGQTISGDLSEPSESLAKAVAARANGVLDDTEAFTYFEFPQDYEEKTLVKVPDGVDPNEVTNESSTYLARLFPGLAALLVEVSQQPEMHRRIDLRLTAVRALLQEIQQRARAGLLPAPRFD